MPSIKPLHMVTRTDITQMAHAAAERGEPVDQANVFALGSRSWRAFQVDYLSHAQTLEPLEA